ncbi:MAG: hypothetical protein ACJ8CB_14400, partial [Ktedonobacteraceae bacterium]
MRYFNGHGQYSWCNSQQIGDLTWLCRHYSGLLAAVTIQVFSPPAATHSFMWKLRAMQPAAAKP